MNQNSPAEIIDSVALLSKEKIQDKVEWIIQKPEIVILIDLSATIRHWRPSGRDDVGEAACHWQASGRDDVEAELVRFIAPYPAPRSPSTLLGTAPAVSAVKKQPKAGF